MIYCSLLGIFVLKRSLKKKIIIIKNGQVQNKCQMRINVAKNSWRYLFANLYIYIIYICLDL